MSDRYWRPTDVAFGGQRPQLHSTLTTKWTIMALTLAILTAVGSLLALLLKVWPTQTEQSDDKLDDEKKKQDALIRDWINNGNKP